MQHHSESYQAAGVNLQAGYRAVSLMKRHIQRTKIPGVLSGIGGFGGLFAPDLSGMEEPVLVSGTDGVGTKLKLAFRMNRHDTIGIDCVAMCVNDIICSGARPLFFLDYIANGKTIPARVEAIVSGVAEGCVQAGCALIGGETAEMPGFYPEGEYDIAGFAVGVVDRKKIIDNSRVQPGDVLVALPSSGVHSNGFSLVRKVFDLDRCDLEDYRTELGAPLGEALLTPTRIYVAPLLALIKDVPVRAVSHITGGGFFENIPRCLPSGLSAKIKRSAIKTPAIFSLIAKKGGISTHDMFNTFNMGVGMVAIVSPEDTGAALDSLAANGVDAYLLGEVVRGDEGVELC